MADGKGKNFSAANRGQRRASDFYETPYSITKQLLEYEPFEKNQCVLEPACGNGAIVKVLQEAGFCCIESYDKDVNFLSENSVYKQIITNPPFSLADDFILHAKIIAENKFCFLMPLSYLHGKRRYDTIWTDTSFPLKKVYVFTRYPMLGEALREDGCYNTGMIVYAWYVWERSHSGCPEIGWIDNNQYILGAKKARAALEGKHD